MIELQKIIKKITPISKIRMLKKEKELDSLLKIPKGLGKLEKLAIQLEGISQNYEVKKKIVLVAASDNGVAKENISNSKKIITRYVVQSMINGTSSINSLAKSFGADVKVVDLGIDESLNKNWKIDFDIKNKNFINKKLMKNGTNNISKTFAMDKKTAIDAIKIGILQVDKFVSMGYNLFATGEMGIGNTTTSSAIFSVYSGLSLDKIVGRGSGIDNLTLENKKNVIRRAIAINNIDLKKYQNKKITTLKIKENLDIHIELLSKIGGLDIACMVGFFLGCAKNRVPVVIDGIISGVAALIAYKLCKNSKGYMIASNIGVEPCEKYLMKELDMTPGIFYDLNLGEGTGAVMIFPFIEAATQITKDVTKYPKLDK